MSRALKLAAFGAGRVSPNPMVGCVVVHENNIIGEGWHQEFGKAHAEVNAINAVENPGLLSESILYVTLEPCSHYGKTPPCADLIIEKKIPKVVIATLDPNPRVSGKGIEKLEQAGIEVVEGVLNQEAKHLNRRFFTAFNKQRPFVILKWAQTADGFIAREDFSSKWITNELSRQFVHKWRAEEDAILVGKNTALYDNPSLNVRDWAGKDPVRIVIDRNLELPADLKLFSDGKSTICYNLKKEEKLNVVDYVKLSPDNMIEELLEDLYNKGIHSVIVEGGTTIINAFVESDFWDEARVFESTVKFGKGIAAPKLNCQIESRRFVGEDELIIYKN